MGEGFLLTYRSIKRGDPNIMVFIIYGLFFDVYMNLHRPFAVKFLTRLGGGEFHISLLNSLPGIIAVFAIIPGSLFINRFKRKKGVISVFFAISRVFVIALALVPFLPAGVRPILFVILLALMNFPDAISQTGLQGFLGDVFDGFTRSRAITLRNKMAQIVAPAVAIVTGLIITFVPRGDAFQINTQAILIYQIFFIAAFGFAILELRTFRRFKESKDEPGGEIPEAAIPKTRIRDGLRAIPETFKDRRFVGFMIPTIFFYFMFQSAWPLFGILQVIDLGANEFHMSINVAVSGLFGFLGAGFWSRLIQKKGNDFALFAAAAGLAASVWTTATSPNIWIYIAWQIFGGFIGIGIAITLLNGLLAATPEKNRVLYISVYNTFVNISLGLSPFFAYAIHNALSARFPGGAAGTRLSMGVIGIGRALAAAVLFVIYLRNKKRKDL